MNNNNNNNNKTRQYKRQNDYNKNNYDRFSLMLPKGLKTKLKEIADSNNTTINKFIVDAIEKKIEDQKD